MKYACHRLALPRPLRIPFISPCSKRRRKRTLTKSPVNFTESVSLFSLLCVIYVHEIEIAKGIILYYDSTKKASAGAYFRLAIIQDALHVVLSALNSLKFLFCCVAAAPVVVYCSRRFRFISNETTKLCKIGCASASSSRPTFLCRPSYSSPGVKKAHFISSTRLNSSSPRSSIWNRFTAIYV